jgi:streptomycin 6-kinase
VEVPASLETLGRHDAGAAWLQDLPALVDRCVERWSLTDVGRPYEGGMAGYVVPATDTDGVPVVLKVQWPHRECEHEGEALRHWAGDGAIRLLDEDREAHALLLERAEPGDRLTASPPDVAVTVIISLVRRLSVPVTEPFTSLADECSHWGEQLPRSWEAQGRPFDADLVDSALGLLRELAPTQGPSVLLHQDLHADNVLAAEREPWLAIDPKPLAGEVEFAVAPMVRDFCLGHSREAVRRRLDRACDELDLDRERARGWAIAQTVAWAGDNDVTTARHVQTARWLID